MEGNTAITPVKNENKSNNAIVKCVIIHLFYNFKNFYFDDLLHINSLQTLHEILHALKCIVVYKLTGGGGAGVPKPARQFDEAK